jgi:hypothetical protein
MKPKTAIDLNKYIGRSGKYTVNGLSFYVAVTNAQANYNVLELLVRPLAGEGESWVKGSFITPLEEPAEASGPGKEKEGAVFGEGEG